MIQYSINSDFDEQYLHAQCLTAEATVPTVAYLTKYCSSLPSIPPSPNAEDSNPPLRRHVVPLLRRLFL
jgi:hypothetical protein